MAILTENTTVVIFSRYIQTSWHWLVVQIFVSYYPKGKQSKIFVFTKIGKFQSEFQTIFVFRAECSSMFSPKASLFLAIIKAAKPVLCFYPKGKIILFLRGNSAPVAFEKAM